MQIRLQILDYVGYVNFKTELFFFKVCCKSFTLIKNCLHETLRSIRLVTGPKLTFVEVYDYIFRLTFESKSLS